MNSRSHRLTLVSLMLVIAIPALAAKPAWVPAAAHAPGAGGSQWRTDLAARNTSGSRASVDLTLHTDTGFMASEGLTITVL